MLFFGHKTDMVQADKALPGRAEPIAVPERHFVLGTPLEPPFPDGVETLVVGMGCFWGAERMFWQLAGRLHDGGRLRRRLHAEPHLRGGLQRAAPATPRSCCVVFDPAGDEPRRRCCALFWESHDPTQGMRQGNDVGTQYRSAILTPTTSSAPPPRPAATTYQERARAGGPRRRSRPRSRPLDTFYYAEDYHQQYLAKNPAATAVSAAPASAARSGCRPPPGAEAGPRAGRRPRRPGQPTVAEAWKVRV